MRLEDLVPTFTTCIGIPDGAFAQSVFVWAAACGEETVLIRDGLAGQSILCPAPTLEEIIGGVGNLSILSYRAGKAGNCEKATGLAVMMGEVAEEGGRKSYLMELCEYAGLGKPDSERRTASEAALRAWLRMREAEAAAARPDTDGQGRAGTERGDENNG